MIVARRNGVSNHTLTAVGDCVGEVVGLRSGELVGANEGDELGR